ncbi:MAG: carboxymuconolactone decarboxylase family protein [Cyclobacteriaceae bacterium]|nr:carboxymuconolactone decarboxylase family protein [Cyclobacteriaceae bacterium]
MEKGSNQMENCCSNMVKGETPMMQQMMKHMQEFMGQMSKEEKKKGKKSSSLKNKEKELVLVGASIATGCKPCTEYHIKRATEVGLTDIEIKKAIEYAYEIRLKASQVMLNHGLNLLEIDEDIRGSKTDLGKITREGELVSIAASYAVNCTSSLTEHISNGKKVGITDDEILEIAELVEFVEKKAKSHVDKILPKLEDETLKSEKFTKNMCC